MTSRTFLHAALLLLLAALLPLHAADTVGGERAKIEALIAHLENLKDATFTRNGSDYDAKSAAKFLRGKWKSHDKEIKTAGDFIAKAATGSSTSGKPYMIRLKGGEPTACGDYLTAQLRKAEGGAK